MSAQGLFVRHIDLSTTHSDTHAGDGAALSVFWWKDLPLGMRASLPEELPFGAAQLRQFAAEFGAAQLAARCPALGAPLRATFEGRPKQALTLARLICARDLVDQLNAMSGAPSKTVQDISVVICTRDRGEALAGCLKSVTTQKSRPTEIVVVDNSVDGNAGWICRRFPQVRYVHEPRAGLSVARNAGIRASRGEIIAFTDDDVELHPNWIAEIALAFSNERIEALTGLVLPARLDTLAQRIFQLDMGGFGTSFVPLRFDQRFFEETRPRGAHVWKIGAGANMAFRRALFERIGLFDERLGAGAAGCSEDSELWYRMLANHGACLYEPRAVAFHYHRREMSELRRQTRSYMKGHVAALVAQYDAFGDRGNLVRILVQLPVYFLKTFLKGLSEGREGRAQILAQEIAGWGAGLQFLFRPGWRRQRAPRLSSGRETSRKVPLGPFLSRNPFPRGWTDGLFYREKMRAIHQVAPVELRERARVLEVGGGRSGLASLLYPQAEIVTLDIDAELSKSQPEWERSTFVCGDARSLPFASDSFDVVTLFDVLEHVEEDYRAAEEALRVVRSGGWVLVSTPKADWRYPYYTAMKPYCPHETQLMQEWGHVRRGYLDPELAALFGKRPERRATFINPVTAFFHDIAFSRLGRRRRTLLYALAAPLTAIGYLLHKPSTRGTETAFAWRK